MIVRVMSMLRLLGLLALAACGVAHAEPYLAVQQGYKCVACHFNPTGGGLRSSFGTVFTENVLPQFRLPEAVPVWSGQLVDRLALGGDLRSSWRRATTPNEGTQADRGVDQLRVYGALTLIRDRLDVYVDELLAPGRAQELEWYARLNDARTGLYVKGGQFYLPFGWRLQDQSSFVREVSGISMTSPDKGMEIGLERPSWSAQVDFTDGIANAGGASGHQVTGQVVWVRSRYRVGSAASFTHSAGGDRRVNGLFAGLRTGPVAWLGEVDLVRDEGFPEGERKLVAALAEADWAFHRGHNLKVTAEFFDPDRHIAQDQKTRWSLVYEWTPIPFLQLRSGVRRYSGIPQNDPDNRHVVFVELHAFL
jgi:hypothetical protein